MQQNYRSEYTNHAHQLNVAVSRHLVLTKKGVVRYQEKPIEGARAKAVNPLIFCVVRDHLSGTFYAEVHHGNAPTDVRAFLLRAWQKKSTCVFCGLPTLLICPASQTAALDSFCDFFGVKLLSATSGFQGGVRDIRELTNMVRWGLNDSFAGAERQVTLQMTRNDDMESRVEKSKKRELWQHGLTQPLVLPDAATWLKSQMGS